MSPDKRTKKADEERPDEGGGDGDAGVGKRRTGAGGHDRSQRSASAAGSGRDGRRKLRAAVERAEEPGPRSRSRKRRDGKAKQAESVDAGGSKARDRSTAEKDGEARGRKAAGGGRRRKGRSGRRRVATISPRARVGRALRAARVGAARLIAGLLGILAAGAALLFAVLGRLLAVVLLAWVRALPPARALANRWRRALNAAAAVVTPKRVAALVVAGAAILLALSQFADYRSVSIGTDAYSGLEAIAPPPEVGREETGVPSAYVFVPLGIACLPLLLLLLRGKRWAGRAIATVGAAAILVALLVDRPAGLDVSEVAMSFEGVEAKLLGGFYAQIAAGLVLVVASLILSRAIAGRAPAKVKGAKRSRRSPGGVTEASA